MRLSIHQRPGTAWHAARDSQICRLVDKNSVGLAGACEYWLMPANAAKCRGALVGALGCFCRVWIGVWIGPHPLCSDRQCALFGSCVSRYQVYSANKTTPNYRRSVIFLAWSWWSRCRNSIAIGRYVEGSGKSKWAMATTKMPIRCRWLPDAKDAIGDDLNLANYLIGPDIFR